MRRDLLVSLCLLALAACATPAPPEASRPTPPRAERLAELTDAVAEVAAVAESTDPLLASALAGVREVDLVVAGLRDPGTVDAAKDTWPRVRSAVEAVDLAPIRPAIRELAFAVDHARAELAAAGADAPTTWESRYLAAEDEALEAMRAYAEAADALAQVLERHWPTYTAVADLTGDFVERRWLYRSSEEAAAAYEVELARHLPDLARAQEEIELFRERRDAAAEAVNEATAEASEVFRDRPTAEPRPSP